MSKLHLPPLVGVPTGNVTSHSSPMTRDRRWITKNSVIISDTRLTFLVNNYNNYFRVRLEKKKPPSNFPEGFGCKTVASLVLMLVRWSFAKQMKYTLTRRFHYHRNRTSSISFQYLLWQTSPRRVNWFKIIEQSISIEWLRFMRRCVQ